MVSLSNGFSFCEFLRSNRTYFLYDTGEDLWVLLSELRKNLAVEFHLLALKRVDERAVRLVAVLADSSVQTNDPEGTIVSLLVAAVVEGILAGMYERLMGETLLRTTAMAIALGALEHVATALCRDDTSFYSRHTLVLKMINPYLLGVERKLRRMRFGTVRDCERFLAIRTLPLSVAL